MQNVFWTPGMTLKAMETAVVKSAFYYYKSNKTQTAASLGISARTLDTRLEEIEAEEKRYVAEELERKRKHDEFITRMRGPARQGDIYQDDVKVDPIERYTVDTSSPVVTVTPPAGMDIAKPLAGPTRDAAKVLPKDAHRSPQSARR